MSRNRTAAAIMLTLVLSPRPALAQPDPAQAGAAQALYDVAIPAMRAGDFAGACPKLEKVVELAPTGIGAKMMLAECYEGLGRLASAWATYVAVEAAAASAGQAERQKKAHEHAARLKPLLARLTVKVPEGVAATPGLEIRRDGVPVGSVEWGIPLPADRGKHTLVVTAPDRQRWERTVDLTADGSQVSISVEALAEQPSGSPPGEPWTTRRKAGLGVAVVGLASLGVGSVFGALALRDKGQSNNGHCLPDNHCDAQGLQLRDQGLSFAAASSALFAVGGAALVTGVTLFAVGTAPTRGVETKIVAGPGRIGVKGSW